MAKDLMLLKMQENIITPLTWSNAHDSCQILDLKDRHCDDVLRLIKHHYFAEDPMCKSIGLRQDKISTQNYLELIKFWIRDTTSLVAISSRSGRVVGTVIARINSALDDSNTYSQIRITHGEILIKLMDLKNKLVQQADIFTQLNCDTIFRIYILSVHPSYHKKGLETALVEACIRMTIALEIPAIVGMFSSCADQELVSAIGFKVLCEIRYSRWIMDDEIVFDNPGIGNYSVALMGMLTPSLEYLWKTYDERAMICGLKKNINGKNF